MRYRTNHECHKIHDEYYECNDCGKQYQDYHMLKHYSIESGGFCKCGSDDLKVMVLHTVYQEFYAPENTTVEDAVELGLELDEWKIADFATRIDGEQK